MTTRRAACRCGRLTAECRGEPVRVSVCHCLACQARSGSAFAAQARWPAADITIAGEDRAWERIADSGRKATYHFCPTCGSTLWYEIEAFPGLIAVPIGAFGDPDFPAPGFSVWEKRKHAWVELVGDIEHSG
ncbi:MAG: GFA family protein [Sphingomonadaceae bacterium]|nr:GFA family protein [Sphingomonadaceae bacterium]